MEKGKEKLIHLSKYLKGLSPAEKQLAKDAWQKKWKELNDPLRLKNKDEQEEKTTVSAKECYRTSKQEEDSEEVTERHFSGLGGSLFKWVSKQVKRNKTIQLFLLTTFFMFFLLAFVVSLIGLAKQEDLVDFDNIFYYTLFVISGSSTIALGVKVVKHIKGNLNISLLLIVFISFLLVFTTVNLAVLPKKTTLPILRLPPTKTPKERVREYRERQRELLKRVRETPREKIRRLRKKVRRR